MSTLNLLRRIFFGLTLTALLFGFQNCSDAPVATKGSDGIKADGDGGENDNQPPPEEEPPKEDPPKEDPPKEDPPKDPPKFSGKGWYVEVGKNGNGSEANPFGRIQQALDAAQAGDGVIISPGVYLESLRTMNQGDAKKPILIFAEKGRGSVEVRAKGRVLNVRHAHQHFLGLVFSGEYGDSDAVRVYTEADGWRLENSEVKESGRDCIDMGAPMDVTITHSLIHHCLNPSGGRTDAHGIVGASVKNLLIKDTSC